MQGFQIIKDRVVHTEGIVRHRTFICHHGRSCSSNSSRNTVTKKINCPFSVNFSCPKDKNPECFVIINKINEENNHLLNRSIIEFEESKKFTMKMIEDRHYQKNCKVSLPL